jgi:hypothetical protein
MQSAAAKAAFVQFMVSLDVREPAAIAIAENNDDHASLLGDFYSNRLFEGVPDAKLADSIAEFLGLPQALQGEHLELTKKTLAEHFRCVRIATAAGKNNAAVTIVRRLVDEYTCPFGVIAPERDLLDYAICFHSVTINGLRDARSKPDGVMSLFPPGMREYLLGKIPELPKMFEHLLAEQDKLQALLEDLARNGPELGADFELGVELGVEPAELEPVAAQITAPSRKRVLVATVSGDNEEASGDKTPPPTNISNLSKIELYRLQCAPRKVPRQGQE